MQRRWQKVSLVILLSLSVVATSLFVTKGATTGISGGGDTGGWEFSGYYMAKNLTFSPLPQLEFSNDQNFYPYGTSNVYQSWGIERDLFFAGLYQLFGHGPWLPIYFIVSLLLTMLGALWILSFLLPTQKAAVLSTVLTLMNFYLVYRYPFHFGLAVAHWMLIGVCADYVIVRTIVERGRPALVLLFARAATLVLSLGLELGYVAGFGLVSFTVSTIFVVSLLIHRALSVRAASTRVRELLRLYWQEMRRPGASLLTVTLLFLLGLLVYFPLALQIVAEISRFPYEFKPGGMMVLDAGRFFVPYLPGLNPAQDFVNHFMGDRPEGFASGSPGWFLIALVVIAARQNWRSFKGAVPILIILLMILTYHPSEFATLNVFPWLKFMRVEARTTMLLPAFLVLMASGIDFGKLSKKGQVLLVLLALTEFTTAYSYRIDYKPHINSKEFNAYMAAVANAPGEAVLDWPFCIVGLDEQLCLNPDRLSGIYSNRKYHHKKVVGTYFARLHEQQARPYYRAGWHHLLKTQASGCLTDAQWRFFLDFFQKGDFAGVNLYEDHIPRQCHQRFRDEIGAPTHQADIPTAGRAVFIPRPAPWGKLVNVEAAKRLKLSD